MRRIFRPDDFRLIDETAQVPDVIFPSSQDETEPETEAVAAEIVAEPEEPAVTSEELEQTLREQITRELTQSIRAELKEELAAEREKQNALYETYMEKAHAKAETLRQEAEREAQSLVAAANAEADSIREAARAAGYEDGVEQKMAEITDCFAGISAELEQIKLDQLGFQEDYARELRELALEICEKLLCTKLDQDDSLLLGLVRRAVKPIRDAGWIKIDVSDKIGDYATVLEKMIAQTRPSQKIEVETRRDADKGTCVIQTADGVVVASVLTQLANIRAYLDEFETECEESDETEHREVVAGAPAS